MFALITGFLAWSGSYAIVLAGKSSIIGKVASLAGVVSEAIIGESVDLVYDILFAIFVTGLTISAALTVSSLGFGSILVAIIDTLIAIAATLVFEKVGISVVI